MASSMSAGATSIAAVLNAVLLYRGLRRAGVVRHGPGWTAMLVRVLVASGTMIGVLWVLHRTSSWWIAAALGERVVWLAVSVAAGAGAYFAALFVLGMRPGQFRVRHD